MDIVRRPAARVARIGNRVRERRVALGLSQTELARRCGLARQTINQIEKIEGYQVTTVVCLRLAEALDTTVDELFFEATDPADPAARSEGVR